MENPSTVNRAVSLHLYSPPFSTCSVFNKQTGQRSPCKVTFWSKYGEHRNRVRNFSTSNKTLLLLLHAFTDSLFLNKYRKSKIQGLLKTINCEMKESYALKL